MEPLAKVKSEPLPAGEAGRHIPALDGIRAIAILLVIPHNVESLGTSYPHYLLPVAVLLHAGWIGVQLFFVLSGFLITGNLFDSKGASNYFSAFFGRRVLRILPLYYAVLCAAFVIAPLLVTLPEQMQATESRQLWLWTFLTNWTEPFGGGVYGFGHFWSLAVEEQFYLIWPLIVYRCAPRALLWVCGVMVGITLGVRCMLVALHFSQDALYMFTIARMDALALGAAVAALIRISQTHAWLQGRKAQVAVAAGIMLFLTAAVSRGFGMHEVGAQTVGYTLLAMGFALWILLTVLPEVRPLRTMTRVLSSAPLRLIGRYSYGMYVLHLPLHVFFLEPLFQRLAPKPTPWESLAYCVIMTAVAFAVAAASYEFFEKRFLKLKGRLTPTWDYRPA
jgi:peptidoglycan/LPS O-acetylase OafA/YrhL